MWKYGDNMKRTIKEKIQLIISIITIILSISVFLVDIIDIFVSGNRKTDFVFEMILLEVTCIYSYILMINISNNTKEDNTVYLTNRLLSEGNLQNLFTGADEILFVGISNDGILNFNNKEIIENATEDGINFKFICINPDSDSYDEIIRNKTKNTRKAVKDSIHFYNEILSDKSKKKVEFYLTDINLPFSMVIKKKKGRIKFVKVDLYGIDVNDRERRSIIINPKDIENISFYDKQWNNILHKSIRL